MGYRRLLDTRGLLRCFVRWSPRNDSDWVGFEMVGSNDDFGILHVENFIGRVLYQTGVFYSDVLRLTPCPTLPVVAFGGACSAGCSVGVGVSRTYVVRSRVWVVC